MRGLSILIDQTRNSKGGSEMGKTDADGLRAELSAALRKCGLSDQEPNNKQEILEKIQDAFVVGNPRAWWTNLKIKPIVRNYEGDSGYLHIGELAPSSEESVWFLVDEDNEEKFLFDVPLHAVPEIIKECRYFEYYIAAQDLQWLLAENDHGDLLFMAKNG